MNGPPDDARAKEIAARDARQEERRRSFDAAAAAYDTYRPGYPDELFTALAARMPPPARVLEIAGGTGHATLPLAQRGYPIRGIELGERLAAIAREKLSAYPAVQIDVGRFEESHVESQSADLVVCASAFHWLLHAQALPKISTALRSGGLLALLWTSAPEADDHPFARAARPIYQRLAPELLVERARESAPSRMSRAVPGILLGAPDFIDFSHEEFRFTRTFSPQEYLGLLGTYSNYLTLPPATRDTLFAELRELLEREFGNQVVHEFRSALQFARRK